jgi:hypothetical protein
MTLGNQGDLVRKLKERVCSYAQTQLASLPQDAASWLTRRAGDWIVQRSASDVDLRRAADELTRRYPNIPRRSESKSKLSSHLAGNLLTSTAASHAAPVPRSKSTEPERIASKRAGSHKEGSHSAVGNPSDLSCGHRATASVPLVDRNAAGSPALSLRPQVLRRMQRLNDDAEFIVAFEKENNLLHEEERKKLLEKQRRQAAVKRDMEEAEAFRLAKLDAEREERERQRRRIDAAIEEARLAEIDEKALRKRKVQQERKTIQEQSQAKDHMLREAKIRDAEENQRLKEYAAQQERSKLLQEIGKVMQSKSAMVAALGEGISAARGREEQRRLHRQESSPAFSTRTDGSAPDPYKTKRAQRELLQSVACQQYEEIRQVKQHDLERMDHSSMEAHLAQIKKQEERERRDREKTIKMRAALVSSLDEELSAQRDRMRREEEEKRELRRIADAEAKDLEQQRHNAAIKEKVEQERRRRQMDAQLVARVERITQPMRIKI